MKIQPFALTKEKAQKELKIFCYIGIAASVLGLFISWNIGSIGGIASIRAAILSYNKNIKSDSNTKKLRILSFIGLILGLVSIIYGIMNS